MTDPKDIVRQGYDQISYEYRDDAGSSPTGRPDYEAWFELSRCRGTPGRSLAAHDLRITWLGSRPHLRPASASHSESYAGQIAAGVGWYRRRRFRRRHGEHRLPIKELFRRRLLLCDHPRALDEQPAIFRNIYRWLRPGGYLLATVGSSAWTGTETDWHGAPMFWSHADRATYVAWLEKTGFQVLWTRFIPEGTGGHTLVLAERLEL